MTAGPASNSQPPDSLNTESQQFLCTINSDAVLKDVKNMLRSIVASGPPDPGKTPPAGENLNWISTGCTDSHSCVTTECTLPSSGHTENYLALLMLLRSLWVSSERSEGTRISTGLILRTRFSNSDRDGPSGKQSRKTSPVLGWTAWKHADTPVRNYCPV